MLWNVTAVYHKSGGDQVEASVGLDLKFQVTGWLDHWGKDRLRSGLMWCKSLINSLSFVKHEQCAMMAMEMDSDTYTTAIYTAFSVLLDCACVSQTPDAGSVKSQSPLALHSLSSGALTSKQDGQALWLVSVDINQSWNWFMVCVCAVCVCMCVWLSV